jgi:predicted DNA binding CopG/RHH family protein
MKKPVKKAAKVKSVASAYDDEALWDSGQLGRDPKYAKSAKHGVSEAIDEHLGLQMISMRIQKDLVGDLKRIARYRGLGYQPIIRDVLQRFARSEIITIMDEIQERKMAEAGIKQSAAL